MKQLTLILLLAIFHLLPAHAHDIEPLKPAKGIKILVTIGQWPGCLAFGICGVVWFRPGGALGMPYTDSPTDNISISDDQKTFELHLSKQRLMDSQPEKLE